MRQFGIISSSIWRSRRFRQLSSHAARLVYLYLHTTTHGNSAGAFVLPAEMAALEMKLPPDEVRAAYHELAAVRLVRYDPEEELLQIVNFFRFNAIASRKHLQGPMRIVMALPRSPVRDCAACDLVVSMWHRREEWRDKVRRLRASETRTDQQEAQKIEEAIAGFDSAAADLVKDLDLADALSSEEIGLDAATLDSLGAALMIPLSHTPIETPTDTTDTDKDKNKTTEKTTEKTTDKDKTTERGSGGEVARRRPPSPPADGGRSGVATAADEVVADLRRRLAERGGS